MIRFQRRPSPDDFEERVGIPGREWLARPENAAPKRPKDYWTRIEPQLFEAFHELCAYSAMYCGKGEVDHFVSIKEDRSRAYEWENYRYASPHMNKVKLHLRSEACLDPFEIDDSWFRLLLPSMQLVPSDTVPDELRPKVENFLMRMKLRDSEPIVRLRRSWYEKHLRGDLSLAGLWQLAPLIARAIEEQMAAHNPEAGELDL